MYTEVVMKEDLEHESMKEISWRSRISEDTPPLNTNLLQDLGHEGMTEAGKRIIEGQETL